MEKGLAFEPRVSRRRESQGFGGRHADRFKLTATFLFGLEPRALRYEPFLIFEYAR